MINPFLKMTIKAVLWYQGEEDTKDMPQDYDYSRNFPLMISQWRYYFSNNSDTNRYFPFGFVQISVYEDNKRNHTCNNNVSVACLGGGILRYGQLVNLTYFQSYNDYNTRNNSLSMYNTFFATAIDLGDPFTPYTAPLGAVHPRYKQQVGKRLYDAGLNVIYNKSDVYFGGPYPINAQIYYNYTYGGDSSNVYVSITFGNVGNESILIKNFIGFEMYDEYELGWFDTFENIENNGMNKVNIYVPNSIVNQTLSKLNVTMIRYNIYDAPCLPYQGIYNCALYDKKSLLPVTPFIFNVTRTAP